MAFIHDKGKRFLDLGREDRGDCDVDSASGLDGKDHEKANLKDILRRKFQELGEAAE